MQLDLNVYLISTVSFGRKFYKALLVDLRAIYHSLKACQTNVFGVMHQMFKPLINKRERFLLYSLPLKVTL